MASEATKRSKALYIVFLFVSISLNIVPEIVSCIYIFCSDKTAGRTTPLIIALAAAFILFMINIIAKTKIRSAKWVIFFGLYYALMNIPQMLVYTLLAIGICTIVDDLIVTPIYRHYQFSFKSNKIIDKRLGE